MKKLKELYKDPILRVIFLMIFFGIVLIIVYDITIHFNLTKNWNLQNLNNLFGSVGFILTAVTIYLLYINYTQQKVEFNKMNELNNKANIELVKSNELIILNNQLEYLTSELRKINFEISWGQIKNRTDFYDFANFIVYSNRTDVIKSRNILINLTNLKIIIELILVTNKNLNHIIKNVQTPTIYLLNRLPTDVELIHNRLIKYSEKYKGYETEKALRVIKNLEDLKKIMGKYKN